MEMKKRKAIKLNYFDQNGPLLTVQNENYPI